MLYDIIFYINILEKKGMKQSWSQFKRINRHSESSVSTTPDKPTRKKNKISRVRSDTSDDIDVQQNLINELNDIDNKQVEKSTAPQPQSSSYLQVPQYNFPFSAATTYSQQPPPSYNPQPPYKNVLVHDFTAREESNINDHQLQPTNVMHQQTHNLLNQSTQRQTTQYVSERNPEWKKKAKSKRSRRTKYFRGSRRRGTGRGRRRYW